MRAADLPYVLLTEHELAADVPIETLREVSAPDVAHAHGRRGGNQHHDGGAQVHIQSKV